MTNEFLDNICVKYFIRKTNLIETNRIRSLDKYWPNLRDYMKTRYDDITEFKTFGEVLYRMKYHIEHRNLCPVCGKPTPFRGLKHFLNYGTLYQKHCCTKCGAIDPESIKKRENFWLNKIGLKHPWCKGSEYTEKIKQIFLDRYGVDNVMKSKEFIDKREKTMLKKYGATSVWNSPILKEKINQTMIEKYGTTIPSRNEKIKEKIKETNIEKYGVDNVLKSKKIREKIKKTNIERYGVDNILKLPEIVEYSHSKEVLEKIVNTKRKNHTFNTSKPEEHLYKILVELYGSDNVKRQYKCDRYPWHCDFYVIPKDLFIEVQGYFTHGDHPFNSSNIDDINRLNECKEKYNSNKHPKYKNIIKVWTITDPQKRNTAIKNNLNYIEIFNCENIDNISNYLTNEYNGGYKVI